jgi:hypothetical protein
MRGGTLPVPLLSQRGKLRTVLTPPPSPDFMPDEHLYDALPLKDVDDSIGKIGAHAARPTGKLRPGKSSEWFAVWLAYLLAGIAHSSAAARQEREARGRLQSLPRKAAAAAPAPPPARQSGARAAREAKGKVGGCPRRRQAPDSNHLGLCCFCRRSRQRRGWRRKEAIRCAASGPAAPTGLPTSKRHSAGSQPCHVLQGGGCSGGGAGQLPIQPRPRQRRCTANAGPKRPSWRSHNTGRLAAEGQR